MKGVMVALVLCGTLLIAGSAHGAPAMQQYRNPVLHYAVTYPASWSRMGVSGADFAAVSPDRNDFVSVSALRGRENATQVVRALAGAFAPFGRPLGGPSYHPFHVHGATGTLAQDHVAANGRTSLVLAFMLSRHGLVYLTLGVVRDVTSHTHADVASALAFIADTAII